MSVTGQPYWPPTYQTNLTNYSYPVPRQYPTYPSNGYHHLNTQDTSQAQYNHNHGNMEMIARKGWEKSIQGGYDDHAQVPVTASYRPVPVKAYNDKALREDKHKTLTEFEQLGKPGNRVLHISITVFLQTPCMTPPWTGQRHTWSSTWPSAPAWSATPSTPPPVGVASTSTVTSCARQVLVLTWPSVCKQYIFTPHYVTDD